MRLINYYLLFLVLIILSSCNVKKEKMVVLLKDSYKNDFYIGIVLDVD